MHDLLHFSYKFKEAKWTTHPYVTGHSRKEVHHAAQTKAPLN